MTGSSARDAELWRELAWDGKGNEESRRKSVAMTADQPLSE